MINMWFRVASGLLLFASSCHFSSFFSCPVLSSPVLSCPVLSCPVLSCPVLSCPVLSCPVLSCPVLSFLSLVLLLHLRTLWGYRRLAVGCYFPCKILEDSCGLQSYFFARFEASVCFTHQFGHANTFENDACNFSVQHLALCDRPRKLKSYRYQLASRLPYQLLCLYDFVSVMPKMQLCLGRLRLLSQEASRTYKSDARKPCLGSFIILFQTTVAKGQNKCTYGKGMVIFAFHILLSSCHHK